MNESVSPGRWAVVRPLAVLAIATAVAGAGTFGWAAVEPPNPPSAGAQGTAVSATGTASTVAAGASAVASPGPATTPERVTTASFPVPATPRSPAAGTETPVTIPGAESTSVPSTEAAPTAPSAIAAPTAPPTRATATAPVPTPVPTAPSASAEAPASGEDERTAVVATDVLNLRAEPGLAGEIVATLAAGERVTLLAGPTTVDGFAWYRLDAAGMVGWSAGEFLRLDEPRSSSAAPLAAWVLALPGSPRPAAHRLRLNADLDAGAPVQRVLRAAP